MLSFSHLPVFSSSNFICCTFFDEQSMLIFLTVSSYPFSTFEKFIVMGYYKLTLPNNYLHIYTIHPYSPIQIHPKSIRKKISKPRSAVIPAQSAARLRKREITARQTSSCIFQRRKIAFPLAHHSPNYIKNRARPAKSKAPIYLIHPVCRAAIKQRSAPPAKRNPKSRLTS